MQLFDAPVHRRIAATGIGSIDNVIVDKGAGLDKFQRGSRAEHGCGIFFSSTCGKISRPGIGRSYSLAAVKHEGFQKAHGLGYRGADFGHLLSALIKKGGEFLAHRTGDVRKLRNILHSHTPHDTG